MKITNKEVLTELTGLDDEWGNMSSQELTEITTVVNKFRGNK